MKMELEVKAPCDGKISFVSQPGIQVANGQKLAVVGGSAASAQNVASSSKPSSPVQNVASAAHPAPVSSAPASAPVSNGGTPVKAPVAGVALRYAVNEGDSVSADDTVLIIESMKMELEIKAGAQGKIHFLAAVGSQVSNGQVIAELS